MKNMASTLTAGLFTANLLRGVHCGDTRVAIARANGVKRLTTDHSEGQRLFAAGKLTKDELIDYPRKNILDSALGARSEPQIDTFTFELLPRDKVFFTSDGVHGKVMLREVRDIAAHHEDPEQFVLEVKELVNSRGPDDNFSILAVFVQ
ncbi:hypothetical protein ELH65_09180 [Rhizobium ruizarguesonis]|nr:hypothetical protein ELH65_09180 [Rhizobium ruizarguesonis]